MQADRKMPFYWQTKRKYISSYQTRAMVYTLRCSQCNEAVIGGTPMNDTGRRYFTHHAHRAAQEHLERAHSGAY